MTSNWSENYRTEILIRENKKQSMCEEAISIE
jgi:hypothetical protein